MKKIYLLVVLFFAVIFCFGQDIPAKPNRLFNDMVGLLSESQQAEIENSLRQYEDSTSNQISFLIISSLNGYPIEDYCYQVAQSWGIGQKDKNNGVLVCIAVNDRKVRIEVGYGLEPVIPDLAANQIIQNDIKPNFRAQAYYEGINGAINSLVKCVKGEFKAEKKKQHSGKNLKFLLLLIIVIVYLAVFRVKKISKSNNLPFWIALGMLNSGGRRNSDFWGGNSGSAGGSSFGGFGGGSFGGGGSSGSW
jgi:uncharacterized protein